MARQRIIIVGGVAAGPAAAAQARRSDPEAEVVLFEQGRDVSYGACELPYLAGGVFASADDLVVMTPEELSKSRGIDVRTLHRVESISPKTGRLSVRDLASGTVTEQRFDKMILATGARASVPFEVEAGADVAVLRTLSDGAALRGRLEGASPGHVAIVGGGFIGLEMAEQLDRLGWRVSLLDRNPPLHALLDSDLSSLVSDLLARRGVAHRSERAVVVRHHAVGPPLTVHTDAGERIGCRLVIAATGIVPAVDLARAAGARIGASGALAVDSSMRTSLRNVWACGDCAEVAGLPLGKPIHVPLSPVAFRTARIAGHNAARRGTGNPEHHPGVVPAYALRIFDQEVASVGLTERAATEAGLRADAVTIRHRNASGRHAHSRPVHVRLVFERPRGRLLGAQLVGGPGSAQRANVVSAIIRSGADVHALYDTDLVYTPPLAPATDPLHIAARAAQKALARR